MQKEEFVRLKKILVTGKNSFTGNAIREYLSSWPEKYHVSSISLRGETWKSENFGGFDTIIHTAGIAHDSAKSSDKEAYYRVNTELAFETAKKAVNDGAGQFVFMSSSIVYGKSAPIGQTRIITRDTAVSPESYYGDSKVKAEDMIMPLDDEKFRNYPVLSKIARRLPFFPDVHNTRSMLYAMNFAEFVRLMIDDCTHGIFWPQNGEYADIAEIVRMIAESHGRKILLLPGCEFPLKVLAHFSGLVNKAFGNLAYDMSLSDYRENYRLYDLRNSITETES